MIGIVLAIKNDCRIFTSSISTINSIINQKGRSVMARRNQRNNKRGRGYVHKSQTASQPKQNKLMIGMIVVLVAIAGGLFLSRYIRTGATNSGNEVTTS